jgi:hypothetical protein
LNVEFLGKPDFAEQYFKNEARSALNAFGPLAYGKSEIAPYGPHFDIKNYK